MLSLEEIERLRAVTILRDLLEFYLQNLSSVGGVSQQLFTLLSVIEWVCCGYCNYVKLHLCLYHCVFKLYTSHTHSIKYVHVCVPQNILWLKNLLFKKKKFNHF